MYGQLKNKKGWKRWFRIDGNMYARASRQSDAASFDTLREHCAGTKSGGETGVQVN
jgi:hypothetical protein